MKNKSLFILLSFFFFMLVILILFLIQQEIFWVKNKLFLSFFNSSLFIIDNNSNTVRGSIPLDLPYRLRAILRFQNKVYLIAVHQIILLDSNGEITKIIETNDTLVDGFFYKGKLYTVGIIQNETCNSQDIVQSFVSYISVFDPSSLSLISRKEFKKQSFEGLAVVQDRTFVSSFHNSKFYEVKNNSLIDIPFPVDSYPSYPSQLLVFNDKIIILGRKQLFIFDPVNNKIETLSNKSICDYYVRASIYNNMLYAICFSKNKTFVFDLNSRKLINEINTAYPYYITVFADRIYVTSAVAKKLYVVDPTSNSVIKELVFKEGPRVIG
jgi:hypothetical protein